MNMNSFEPMPKNQVPHWQSVMTDIGEQAYNLTTKLTKDPWITHAWSLSPIDIVMASQNAYCPYECSVFPANQVDKNTSMIEVKSDENPILFSHLMNTLAMQGKQDLIPQCLSMWYLTITKEMYIEYIEALQWVARYMFHNPRAYIQEAVDITAGLVYTDLMRFQAVNLMPMKPMISIDSLHDSRITMNYLGRRLDMPIDPGESIFIAWAGLSSVSNILSLSKNKNHKVILNDKNPFVSGVLRKVARYLGSDNIEVSEGNFAEIQYPENSIGLIILSLVHAAGHENIWQLAKNAQKIVKNGGKVIVFNPTQPNGPSDVSAEQMSAYFLENGFGKMRSNTIKYTLAGDVMSESEAIYLLTKTTSSEIVQILSDKMVTKKIPKTTTGEFMIFESRK